MMAAPTMSCKLPGRLEMPSSKARHMISKVGIKKAKVLPEPVHAWVGGKYGWFFGKRNTQQKWKQNKPKQNKNVSAHNKETWYFETCLGVPTSTATSRCFNNKGMAMACTGVIRLKPIWAIKRCVPWGWLWHCREKKAAIHVKNRACSEYGSMELSYLVIFQCTCLLYIDMFVFLSYNFRLYILELRTIYNPFPVYKKSSTPKHRGCRLRHLQRRPISRSRHGEEAVKSNRRKS